MAGLGSKIKHVVVLMLENRSFDNVLGRLYPNRADFNGLSGTESNPCHDPATGRLLAPVPVWNDPTLAPDAMTVPSPDPGERFDDINRQLFGLSGQPSAATPPPMTGFVDNYLRQYKPPTPGDYAASPYLARAAMHHYLPQQVPALSSLARAFAVSDQWHASAPNQTWPNRFFVHTGTARGYVNNSPAHFPYEMPTVFDRLQAKGLDWAIFFHDVPQALTLLRLQSHPDHFHRFDEFLRATEAGLLPAYSFIEPHYLGELGILLPNDQHPPHNVALGDQLIARVYNALRKNEAAWRQTLLIVTYDEHGGCYDHAPPPRAVSPDDYRDPSGFAFDRYGVRVPAVIASPYVEAESMLRAAPDGLPHQGPPYPFDHTSIIKTLRLCFDLGPKLTNRDDVAPDLDRALTLDQPTNLGPETIAALPYVPTAPILQDALTRPLNDMQAALHGLAGLLPAAGQDPVKHATTLPPPPDAPNTAGEALAEIKNGLARFFGTD